MASILQKAKQQKAKKAPVTATNLLDLNKAASLEEKSIAPTQTTTKKQDDDWGTEQHEAIEIAQIKTEKKEEAEEDKQPKPVVQQQKVENVTWGDTKDMDEQEGLRIAAAQAQAQQGEVEDPNKGKKVMKSWVPQLREDGGNASSTFEEEKEYFPEMGVDILTKKIEKPKPTSITRSEETSSTSSSNPPRFSGGSKGGFKPLEMTEQQKKLLEISENNKKEYSNPPSNQNGEFGGPRGVEGYGNNNGPRGVEGYGKSQDSYGSSIGRNTNQVSTTPADLTGSELFGSSSATQPPRFTSKKAAEGGNFVPIQKTEQDIKQEEAQKRIEEMLKEKRENAAKTVDNENRFEMRRNVTEKKQETQEQPQVNASEDQSVAKPPPRFVNANKTATTGPKFKDIEVKEEKLPGGLEEKKYSQKREAPKEEDKQQQQEGNNGKQQATDDGFKMVRA